MTAQYFRQIKYLRRKRSFSVLIDPDILETIIDLIHMEKGGAWLRKLSSRCKGPRNLVVAVREI